MLPQSDRQAFSQRICAKQDIQQEHRQNQLQLYAQRSQHHQIAQQKTRVKLPSDTPRNATKDMQLPKKGKA
jgi:hypothetical protein